jgi:DnaJ-class molecular chaperone
MARKVAKLAPRPTRREVESNGRCQRCLGMGYHGAAVRGRWRVVGCRRCEGTGTAPNYQAAAVSRG